MNVAHFGTFDVDNYGDLLFPYIAEWRMPSICWTHLSPTNNKLKFTDALETSVIKNLMDANFQGVLVGGGNIFHLRNCPIKEYENIEQLAIPSLIIGAANLASIQNIPFIINGPSIRNFKFGHLEKNLLNKILLTSSYAALRDGFSFGIASNLNPDSTSLIPDTAFDISRMWPLDKSISNRGNPNSYIIVHVNARYGGHINDVAKSIDQIAREFKNIEVRFLPIGPCHGDIEYMHAVASKISSTHRIISDVSLKNFAQQIALSQAYFGSSMHGFITALSYGVPASLVLNRNPLDKFIGLISMAEAPNDIISSTWMEAASKLSSIWIIPEGVRRKIFEKLDMHWNRISHILSAAPKRHISIIEKASFRNWRLFTCLSQIEIALFNEFSKKRSVFLKKY